MKLNSHTKIQIVSVILLCAVFVAVLLYSEGYFDFTFITRPGSYSGNMEQQTPVDPTDTQPETEKKEERPTPETNSWHPNETQQREEDTVDWEAIESEFNSKFEDMFQTQGNMG